MQTELAEKAIMAKVTINKIYNGKIKVTEKSARKLSRAFPHFTDLRPSFFEDGKAFFTKDFEKILAKQKTIGYIAGVKPSGKPTPGRGETRMKQLTRSDGFDKFKIQLTYLYNYHVLGIKDTSAHKSIPEAALSQILDNLLEYLSATGFDLEFLNHVSSGFKRVRTWRTQIDADPENEGEIGGVPRNIS